MNNRPEESTMDRLSLAVVGAVAGLALWALMDVLPDQIDQPRLILLATVAASGFFSVLLALLGPTKLYRATLAALALSLPASCLFFWASYRFATADGVFERGDTVVAVGILLAISTPFAAAYLEDKGRWKDYSRLFDLAWTIVVRYAAAGLFVGVVWAVLMLSDALLSLVGVTIIDDLLDFDPVPWLINGLALGLGMAIVHELRDYVSPFLIIQLLRILMPLLLVVLAVFILALPMQGLSGLFGGLSPAVLLSSVAFAGITLISAAIHRDEEVEIQGGILRRCAQALAVLIAIPAALAIYAVVLRISEYGLTPDRIAALVCTAVVGFYGVGYAICAALRGMWMARIRRVNLVLAGMVVLFSALWLTPVLNPERMSVASQLKRAQSGVPASELPIWEFVKEWGHAGTQGAEALRQMTELEGHTTILQQLDAAETAQNEYAFDQEAQTPLPTSLTGLVPLRPLGATLPDGALDNLSSSKRRNIVEACALKVHGKQPGCVIVLARFDPAKDIQQGIGFFLTENGWVRVQGFEMRGENFAYSGDIQGLTGRADADMIADILDGKFQITPVQRNALEIKGMALFPEN